MVNNRYSRNIACIGAEGQQRLSAASVFIIGCGALGGQVAMLLAGAGVGRIGIADYDTIDPTNLQRQLFFSEQEAGKSKTLILGERMRALNSEITVDVYQKLIRREEAFGLLSNYDFIIDATDNPATKYMVDEICGSVGRPGCVAGVAGWRGQVMCISGDCNDSTLRFADIFPRPDAESGMTPCSITGVMGPAASLIASIQASEALSYLLNPADFRFNRLFVMDLERFSFEIVSLGE